MAYEWPPTGAGRLLGLPACACSVAPSLERTSWPCQFNYHQPLRFNAGAPSLQFNSPLARCILCFPSLPPPVHHHHLPSLPPSLSCVAARAFVPGGGPRCSSFDRGRHGRRGGAVGIGVRRPCGERGRKLRGVPAAGRAGGAAVRRVQGGGLRGGRRVASLLLLVVGGHGQDRRVGAGRLQGRQHAVRHQAPPRGHLRHALHAALRAGLRRRGVVGVLPVPAARAGAGGHRALRHRADAPRQGRRRRRRRQAQAVPVAALVRLPLRQLQPGGHGPPPLRPRRGAAARYADGGGRAVHPRVHLVVGVLDGDGAAAREPRGAFPPPAVRRGPAGFRAEPEAGGLAVHAAGARGDDRAVRDRAPRGEVLPPGGALAGLHPRAGARRPAPRRRQVPHPRRAALLPGAARGGGHAVRAAGGGAAPGVAAHRVRRLRGVLVRAPQPHRQHRALQAPPPLGARLPRLHPLQVRHRYSEQGEIRSATDRPAQRHFLGISIIIIQEV